MRTIVLALTSLLAIGAGALIARHGPLTLPVAVVVCAALALAGGLREARSPQRGWALALGGLLACAGVMRGASELGSIPSVVPERGSSGGQLRVFEVRGASEPGPRCKLRARALDSNGPPLQLSAPPQVCPRAQGERIAVLAQALRPRWSGPEELEVIDLGRGPVVWSRSRPRTSMMERPAATYWRFVARVRQRAWTASRGDPSHALVAAVGLGLRSALAPDQREQLRAAGLGHLIAVSGLHVAVAGLWLQALGRRAAASLGFDPGRACVLVWIVVWGYVGVTGGAASAVRAAAMLTALELGALIGRPSHGPTILAVVAAAMLMWRPGWLWDPGFCLSVAAMAAIVTAPRGLGPLAMSWRITWATAPLTVLCFDVAPLHGLVANAVALPVFAVMMPAALVATLARGPVASLGLALAKLMAAPILDVSEVLARLPSAGAPELLSLGVLALVVRFAVERAPSSASIGGSMSASLRTSIAPWLPPRLAAWAAVLVSFALLLGVARPRPAVQTFDWIALGSVRARAVLVADPHDPRRACLERARGSTRVWRWLLASHGVTRLGLGATSTDPQARTLAAALERAEVEVELGASSTCPQPDPAEVREALRSCRFVHLAPGPSLARVHAGQLDCRVEDRWVRVPVP